MGVAAFVMAERLEIPYPRIALAAVIPSIVFYLALFLTACRPPVAVESKPAPQTAATTENLRRRLHLLLPLVLLVTLFALGKPASFSAAGAAAACLMLGFLMPPSQRPTLTEWRDAINSGIRQAAEVAVPIAAIGIVITVAVQSGLALRFSVELVEMSAGQPALALLLVIRGCLVLGMGLPTVAAYVLGATLLVPILLDLGFSELPAHFFVFYYCVLSMVTPPVALASAAAAGLAGASFLSVALHALRFGLATSRARSLFPRRSPGFASVPLVSRRASC
jgi:TRAP-type uncharacterized transport system fused permease subunit